MDTSPDAPAVADAIAPSVADGVEHHLDPRSMKVHRIGGWIVCGIVSVPMGIGLTIAAIFSPMPVWAKASLLGGLWPAVTATLAWFAHKWPVDRTPSRLLSRRRRGDRDQARRRLAQRDLRATQPRPAHRRLAGAGRARVRSRDAGDFHRGHRAREGHARRTRPRPGAADSRSPAGLRGAPMTSDRRLHPLSFLFGIGARVKELALPLDRCCSSRAAPGWAGRSGSSGCSSRTPSSRSSAR